MTDLKIDISVIGAMKSASSTVTDFLRQHPGVFVPQNKTLNFFSYGLDGATLSERDGVEATASEQAVRSEEEYAKHFTDSKPHQLLCDCSDSYYFYPGTAGRLHAHNPDMKIVLVMREPVSRAYSSFNHARSHLLEMNEDFKAVFARPIAEEENLLPIRRYKLLGYYGALISPFVQLFGTEQIHLVAFENLVEDYDGTLKELTDFLGLPPHEGEKLWSNPSYVPPSGFTGKAVRLVKGPARKLLRFGSNDARAKERIKSLMKLVYKRPDMLSQDVKDHLKPAFKNDIARLEAMFGPGFYSHWV